MWRRWYRILCFVPNERSHRPNLYPLTIFRFVDPNSGEFYQNQILSLGDIHLRWLQQYAPDFVGKGSRRPVCGKRKKYICEFRDYIRKTTLRLFTAV